MESHTITWRGQPAIQLRTADYEALILPWAGANCVALRHIPSGADLLRTPPDAEALRQGPNVYGLPLLFPPNRIEDGVYTFQGRTYRFPINEPARHHHIHGLLSGLPFQAEGEGTFVFRATEERPYLQFPHAFTVIREYRLTDQGVSHRVTFQNDSAAPFPLGTGIHAAWRLPFRKQDAPGAYRLSIPALREWVLDDERKVPTGEMILDSPLLCALRSGSLVPDAQPLSALLQCGDGPIILRGPAGALCCQSRDYGFIMLWNGGGGQGFVCPEPQTWAVNAPNLPLPWDVTGMRVLAPGEQRTFSMFLQWLP